MTKPTGNPVGKPPLIITDEMVKQAELMASRGLILEQIADCLGIGLSTLCAKQNEYSEFKEAIKRGRAKGVREIANCLFQGAKSGNITAQIFYLKCRGKFIEAQAEADDDDTVDKAKNAVKKLKGKKDE